MSRLQLFDLMGSERFSGENAAHDTSKSATSTESGWDLLLPHYILKMDLLHVVACGDVPINIS